MPKDTFTTKEILHLLLKGMDPYLSCGVPEIYWNLIRDLTSEVYGFARVAFLDKFHKTYTDGDVTLHSLEGWEDGGQSHVLPEDIIARLEVWQTNENKTQRNHRTDSDSKE